MEVEQITEDDDTFEHLRYALPLTELPPDDRLQRIQFDGNSNYCSSQPQSECNQNLQINIDREQERKEAEIEYRKFLQSLSIPIDEQQEDNNNDDEDDPDFCLNDLLNIDEQQDENVDIDDDYILIHPLPTTSPKIMLTKMETDKIKCLMNDYFQLLFTIRHLTIDKRNFEKQHEITTNLIYDLEKNRENANESIRTTLSNNFEIPYHRLPGKNYPITRKSANNFTKQIYKNMIGKTAFNINGMQKYFKFNQRILKSFNENIKYFKENKIKLNKELIPSFKSLSEISTTKISKVKKKKTPYFSKYEGELLQIALIEYGNKIRPKSPRKRLRGEFIPDWISIQKRYFPHKSIQFLTKKMCRLRKTMGDNDNNGNYKQNIDNFGRSRAKSKTMSNDEIKLLLKGIEIFGLSDWASISKQLLPKWDRRELRKMYHRKVKPTLTENQEIELLSKFNEKNQNQQENDLFLKKLKIKHKVISKHDNDKKFNMNNYKQDEYGFPILSEKQEKEIINNPYKLQKLRNKIKEAMEKRDSLHSGPCDFFNPSYDVIIPLDVTDVANNDATIDANTNLIEALNDEEMTEFFNTFNVNDI